MCWLGEDEDIQRIRENGVNKHPKSVSRRKGGKQRRGRIGKSRNIVLVRGAQYRKRTRSCTQRA